MVLPVRGPEPPDPEQAVAAQIDHPRRQLEVATLAGRPVQLDEGHLDLGMAVDRVAAARAELAIDRVGRPRRDAQQPVVTERALPGHRRLDQVAEAVQLVAPGQVLVLAPGRDDLDVGVQVAVLALGPLDQADDLVRRRRRTLPCSRPSSQPMASSHLYTSVSRNGKMTPVASPMA